MPISISIGRISSAERPSGRFLSPAIRRRIVSFSSLSNASSGAPSASEYSGLSGSAGSARIRVRGGVRSAGQRLERLALDGLGRVLAVQLVLDLGRLVESVAEAI